MTDARLKHIFDNLGPTMDLFLREDFSLDEREELATAVRVALGTDSLSDFGEIIPDIDSTDRRGWWGDIEAEAIWGGWPIGCKNWLLTRAKITESPSSEGSTLERARQYTIKALQPFIDKRIASQIDVEAFRTELNCIEVHAIIYRGPESEIDLRYQILWQEEPVLENVVITPPVVTGVIRRIPFKSFGLSSIAPTIGRSNNIFLLPLSGNLALSRTAPTAFGAPIITSPRSDLLLSSTVPSITMIGGNDIYTKILLHMNGSDGGTVFTDSNIGGAAHTWTATNAVTSTTTPKFGTASGFFNGTGWIDTPDHNDFTFGSGDWTADCWFNRAGGDNTRRLMFGQMDPTGSPANQSIYIELYNANDAGVGNANCLAARVSNGINTMIVGTTAITSTGWHHVAFVRTGNVLKLFLDGVQEGGNVAFTGSIQNSTGKFAVGRGGEYPSLQWNGYIDEFRLSVGIARWTSNFTPPTFAWG